MPLNPKKTLVAVSAYSGDLPQVSALAPLYVHHGFPVVVLSPENAPIKHEQVPWALQTIFRGNREWAGPDAVQRHALFLKALLDLPFDFYLFNDSDSICLLPEIPQYLFDDWGTHFSNEVLDTNPGASLLPKIAMQPPYFFSRYVLEKLVRANPAPSYFTPAPHENLPIPTGCPDHYQVQLVYGAGLPHLNFRDGASFETVSRHGLETMAEHVRVHKKNFVHSVKSAAVMDRLLAERNRR
jgi:hypothetical protein